jgi:putative endonuclease
VYILSAGAASEKIKSQTKHVAGLTGLLFKTRVRFPAPPPVFAFAVEKAKAGAASKLNFNMNLHVYILQSEQFPDTFYTAITEDIETRLKDHNSGKCSHTSKYAPWRIKTFVTFTDRKKATDFEKYLKTSSGRAFAKKRLWTGC